MDKLCTLKDLSPGTVIRMPKEYASRDAETAVVLGLEYASDKVSIRSELLKQNGDDFVTISMPATSEDAQLMTVDDAAMRKSAIKAFVSHHFNLPTLTMSSGCDPEIFVTKADGTVFPAWEFMPSEDDAHKMAKQWLLKTWKHDGRDEKLGSVWETTGDVTCPHAVPSYWDGAQAEFAPWAKSCLETLHYGTREGLKSVLSYARAKDPLAKLTLQNVVELPETVLKNAEGKYIQFRCSQSLNIYNDPGDGIPDARAYKYRCAGGHIHVGFTRNFTAPGIEQIVRGLDGVLGVIGVSLAAGIDNPERRHTYGRAGEFRLPSYGVEYRVLSNFWLSHPAIAMLVFELARASVRLAESGLYNLCWNADEQEIRDVINNCDVNGARAILTRNAAVIMGMLKGLWTFGVIDITRAKMQTMAFKTIMHGINEAVKDPFDIEGNWKLGQEDDWKLHCRGAGDNWRSLVEGMK